MVEKSFVWRTLFAGRFVFVGLVQMLIEHCARFVASVYESTHGKDAMTNAKADSTNAGEEYNYYYCCSEGFHGLVSFCWGWNGDGGSGAVLARYAFYYQISIIAIPLAMGI
jgi:hypothetical protein